MPKGICRKILVGSLSGGSSLCAAILLDALYEYEEHSTLDLERMFFSEKQRPYLRMLVDQVKFANGSHLDWNCFLARIEALRAKHNKTRQRRTNAQILASRARVVNRVRGEEKRMHSAPDSRRRPSASELQPQGLPSTEQRRLSVQAGDDSAIHDEQHAVPGKVDRRKEERETRIWEDLGRTLREMGEEESGQ